MNRVVLLTGGNLDDRIRILQDAKKAIEMHIGRIYNASPIIKSEAWGFESKQDFLNQVIVVDTSLSPIEVLNEIQKIEIDLGRVRKSEQWVSRLIDIDILFYNDEIIESDRLIIPHKHIQDRRFTLYALNQIMAAYQHPIYKKSIKELLHNCDDKSKVEVYYA
jgi:2-amino-4-hydroxy-6-hydroxymethyldihydropteridine diphosphokinase